MPHRIYLKLFLFLLPFIIFNCQDTAQLSSNQQSIQENIEKDLQDGLSEPSPLTLDMPNLPKTKYTAEKEHSSISFHTKHWEIVDLVGWFEEFDIVMYADSANFSDAIIYGRVNPRSIKMPNMKMAGTVQQAPYIDTERYDEVTFLSTKLTPTTENQYLLSGTFTMNGIEKETTFEVKFNGFAYPGEQSICGFDVRGAINRNDFKVGGDDELHSGRKIHHDLIYLTMSLRME